MKLFHLLFFILIFLFTKPISAEKINGYLINKNNEKVEVTFDIPLLSGFLVHYAKLQNKVKYFTSNQKKKIILRPGDAKEIGFTFKKEKIRMLSVKNTVNYTPMNYSRNIFLKLEIEGKLKLFSHYKLKQSTSYSNNVPDISVWLDKKYYLQKNAGKLFKPTELGFRKQMAKYLNGCNQLVKKIQNKHYRKNDLKQIVGKYNETCFNL